MDSVALASRCMDILCESVGIVEAERLIYYIKTGAFDYTKWQRDFYDAIPEDELRNRVRKYNAENPFQGDKAVRV